MVSLLQRMSLYDASSITYTSLKPPKSDGESFYIHGLDLAILTNINNIHYKLTLRLNDLRNQLRDSRNQSILIKDKINLNKNMFHILKNKLERTNNLLVKETTNTQTFSIQLFNAQILTPYAENRLSQFKANLDNSRATRIYWINEKERV